GSTVVVVEHDEALMRQADWLIDMGPEAGDGGGYIVAQGTPADVTALAVAGASPPPQLVTGASSPPPNGSDDAVAGRPPLRSVTALFLAGAERIELPAKRRKVAKTRA